jgi:PAS domain S-box-containing protein
VTDTKLNNPEVASYVLSVDGKFIDVSENCEKIIGFKKEELIGMDFRKLVHPQDLPGLLERYQKTLQGIAIPYEYRVITKSGDYVLLTNLGVPIRENGIVVRTEGTIAKVANAVL